MSDRTNGVNRVRLPGTIPLERALDELRRAHPHLLRHLKARVLLNNGALLEEVQDILGHASPETTKLIYARYSVQHLRNAFDRFSLSARDIAARSDGRQRREGA